MQDAEINGRHTERARDRRVTRRGFVIGASALGLSTAALFTAACSQPSAPAAPPPAPGKADAPAKPAEAAKPAAPPAPPAAGAAASGQQAAAPAAKAGTRTVTMWWEGKLPFEEKLRDEQVADFQKKHPDIAINRTLQADIQQAVIPGFSTGTAPDVTQTEGDFRMRKGLVDGNYILPLDQYYDQRKWPVLDWARTWSKIGGTTWEVPYEAQTHGIYYNKTALKKLGIEIPKTYDDVMAAADKAKQAGLVPFASDNDKGTNIRRVIMTHLFAVATPAQVRDILFGEAKFDSPEMVEAIERSAAIFSKGYSDGKLGNTLTSDAATPDFAAGRNIFWISGTFNGKRYKAQLKDFPDLDWGYMDLPPINSSLKWTTVGGVGSGFAINAKAQDVEAALKVIEYNMGLDEYFNKTSLEVLGFIPCVPIKTDGLTLREDDKYLIDSLSQNRDIGLQTNKLWPPEMVKYEEQAGQGVAAGEVTPKEFIATLAKLWDEAKRKPGERWIA
ncbi:MAG TPA: ABC transporter substrate-binding protein [Chloroflexota bacterium]|nr:ABC transporter substrate-binding protein [Chloroflexota bacterium]